MAVDETDRRIIAALQAGLGGSPTPYADAAKALALAEEELLRRLRAMKKSGLLRGVRALLDQRRVGLAGNVLVAWTVGEGRVEEVGKLFAARAEVSHCVERRSADGWPSNLYTMIHAESAGRWREVVREMKESAGLPEPVVLETLRELKKSPPRYF
jgi:DNA-binding Lrp family transcriptional regulator